jgi:hypothetical protein
MVGGSQIIAVFRRTTVDKVPAENDTPSVAFYFFENVRNTASVLGQDLRPMRNQARLAVANLPGETIKELSKHCHG